jgi:hypothetical protein
VTRWLRRFDSIQVVGLARRSRARRRRHPRRQSRATAALPLLSPVVVGNGASGSWGMMGPARGCRRVPGKDAREMASSQPNATIPACLAPPGAATKTAKSTWRSLCRPYPGRQCGQS